MHSGRRIDAGLPRGRGGAAAAVAACAAAVCLAAPAQAAGRARDPILPTQGGADCTQAPLLAPGRYRDHFDYRQTKLYRVDVRPGQALRASAIVRPPAGVPHGSSVRIAIRRADGDHRVLARGGSTAPRWDDTASGGATTDRLGWGLLSPGQSAIRLCVEVTGAVPGSGRQPTDVQVTAVHPPLTAADVPSGFPTAPGSTARLRGATAAPADAEDGGGPGAPLLAGLGAGGLLAGAAARVAVWRRGRRA